MHPTEFWWQVEARNKEDPEVWDELYEMIDG
jgi:hypothetical protein